MSKDNNELFEVTMLRAIMQRHTAGWVVQKLAYLQEEEERNIECAENLRGILGESSGPYLVDDEEALSFNQRRDPPPAFGHTR